MQAPRDFVEAPGETLADRLDTKHEPLREDVAQTHDLGPTVEANHVQVDAIGALEIGGRE